MYGKRKSGVFYAVRVGFQVSFWKFHSAGTYVMSSQRSNIQVTITVTCLNFAVTGSRILLHPLSLNRRGKPSRKIALNSNGEVNCRELAQRPWYEGHFLISTSFRYIQPINQDFIVGEGETFQNGGLWHDGTIHLACLHNSWRCLRGCVLLKIENF